MARKQSFLAAQWTESWKESYARLTLDRQRACDEVALALIKQSPTPGHRIKPIHPEKYYSEARINSGDRIIFRVAEGTILFVNIVHHDDIGRYGKRPRKP